MNRGWRGGGELGAEKRRSEEIRGGHVGSEELQSQSVGIVDFRKGQIIFIGKIFLILLHQFGYLVIKQ